jgi:transcription elongation GreA/GreB family factor
MSLVASRVDDVRESMARAKEAMFLESKPSDGDKFETGNEMMQQEMEKAQQQLDNLQAVYRAFKALDVSLPYDQVRLGALVHTSKQTFFICSGIGKIRLNDHDYMTMAPSAPLAQALLGRVAGDRVVFNQQEYIIQSIV